MKALFRVDASFELGSGHVMRCLVLAEELVSIGWECIFLCSDESGNLISLIRKMGFKVDSLELKKRIFERQECLEKISITNNRHEYYNWQQDIEKSIAVLSAYGKFDWIIVDHYSIDFRWQKIAKNYCSRLMVIDDLANRMHDCELLLDQNFYNNLDVRYSGLIPNNCQMLLGPKYALLRKEFTVARNNFKLRTGKIRKILIFFGSSDLGRYTEKVLFALDNTSLGEIMIDVVVGRLNPQRDYLKKLCLKFPSVNLIYDASNMAELISKADLCIGAGGSSIWERCYLGLPTITIATATNQLQTSIDVCTLGAIKLIDISESNASEKFRGILISIVKDSEWLIKASEIGINLVECGTKSIVEKLSDYGDRQ